MLTRSFLSILNAQVVVTLANVSILIVTSRNMSSEDLGFSALYIMLLMLIFGMGNLGVDNILIARKSTFIRLYSSLFLICLVFLILSLSVFLVASFFSTYPYVFTLFGVAVVTSSLHLINDFVRTYMSVQLRHNIVARASIYASIIKAFIIILLSFSEISWSSIAIGFLCAEIVILRVLLLHAGPIEGFKLIDIDRIKTSPRRLFGYLSHGLLVAWGRLVANLTHGIDRFFISVFYGLDMLAGYTRAHQIVYLPDASIRNPLTTVVLSFVAKYPKEKINIFKSFLVLINLLCILPLIVFSAYGGDLINWLLGDRWEFIAPYIPWLTLIGVGKVFFGLGIIASLSDLKTKYWSQVVTASFFIYLLCFAISFIVFGDMYRVIISYALISFAYWSIFGLYPFLKISSVVTSKIWLILFKYILCVVSAGLVLLEVKLSIDNYLFGLISSVTFLAVTIVTFNIGSIKHMYRSFIQ